MKEDVLTGIRDHVRAERADDAALEAVSRGEVGSAAVAELERRAESDADVRAMLEASRPLGDDVLDAIAAKAKLEPAKALEPVTSRALPKVAQAGGNGRVLPFLRRAAVVVAPFAVAAAVFVYLGRGGEPGPRLPEYAIVAGGEKEMRGADDAPAGVLQVRGGPDAAFEILARPMTSAGGSKVIAYVFAIGEDRASEPNPVDAKIDIAPEGAVRIRGRSKALTGARELRVVVATAGGPIKGYEDALSRARAGRTDAEVRVLVVSIVKN